MIFMYNIKISLVIFLPSLARKFQRIRKNVFFARLFAMHPGASEEKRDL